MCVCPYVRTSVCMCVCMGICIYICACVCMCVSLLCLYVYVGCILLSSHGIITEDAYRKHINEKNPLGMGGNLAKAYGGLLHEMWSGNTSYTHPRNLKVHCMHNKPLPYFKYVMTLRIEGGQPFLYHDILTGYQ